MAEIIPGSKAFKERVPGADNTRLRIMEALGIIRPTKSANGWRIFSDQDAVNARAWLAQNTRQRGRKHG